jgi:hypothetical protein
LNCLDIFKIKEKGPKLLTKSSSDRVTNLNDTISETESKFDISPTEYIADNEPAFGKL